MGRLRSSRAVAVAVVLLVAASFAPSAAAQNARDFERSTPVGVPVDVRELVLPGPELRVRPVDIHTPVVVRITDVFAHGDAFRYDLTFFGLDPGAYDLGDFLQRRDGAPADDLPELAIEIVSVLPPGQVEPNRLKGGEVPEVGGYRFWLWAAGVAWVVGLGAILYFGRRRHADAGAGGAREVTLAERLRPLVERAVAGELPREQRAELELTLIAFWRKRLGIEELGAAEALKRLKDHADAGPLLRALEDWLHRPEPLADVDVGALLAPYRGLPSDALDVSGASGSFAGGGR